MKKIYAPILEICLFIAIVVACFAFGPPGLLNNPELRRVAPTAVITEVTPEVSAPWWETDIDGWLTPSESLELREKENIVNFTLIHQDEIRYASTQSFQLTEEWEQTRPSFVKAVSLDGTAVVVQIGARQFHLNALQPFTWRDAPGQIVMVDAERALWVIDASSISPISLSDVQLNSHIDRNQKLEISFIKQ
ncbi:MAG: hypothetical protein H6774_02145 [Pseudomonadales bacterium]|nr:hypothetical protein [Candidatus Woesebacteria bacterium]MCB9801868.1 hypothetical protein [Pseudomonadales bacterium]